MRRATSEEFARDPLDRYVVGRAWICFCTGPVAGALMWGNVQDDDARTLFALSPVTHTPTRPRHGVLFDARGITGVEGAAYGQARRYMEVHRPALEDKVTRQALVRPAGWIGAAVAGFSAVVSQPCPTEVFTDRRSALDWIGAHAVADELDDVEQAAKAGAIVPGVRDALAASLTDGTSLERLARRLGVSPRTLQRRLLEEGTTFRHEVNTARIAAAKLLLQEGYARMTDIAFRVGYSSATHLSNAFRQVVGTSPTEWRSKYGRSE